VEIALTTRDYFERAATVYGQRIGIVDEPAQAADPLPELTYQQVLLRSRALAAGLQQNGIGPGDRVAIVSHNAARLLVVLYGVTGWGRVAVPINFRLNRTEIQYIIDHSGASVTLVDPELMPDLAGLENTRVVEIGTADEMALFDFDLAPHDWQGDENATATINYTSGTTARPKGVELTHRNLWINAAVFGWQAGVNDRDVYLHTLPMFHCNGWGMPLAVAAMGVKQVVLRKVDGGEILRRVDQHGVTLMCGAPAVVTTILDAAKSWRGEIPGRDRVRIICAGAPPPTAIIERVETELGWEFIQIYGLTETSPLLTMSRSRAEWDPLTPHQRAQKLSRAGAPALGVQMQVDEQGELLARGNVVLKSYWDQPQETQQAIRDDWFHTGDGGIIDEENHAIISDRKKDVIISGGENVSSIEVEDALYSHPAVAVAAVIGVPDKKWGETVKALVVRVAGATADERDLIDHCRHLLAHYKCPTSVEFRDQLDRTATGKLQKFKLREPYWKGFEKGIN
jgi:acyl-CoA synthetase (AMP-forming)/AMP-acid ligase II